jgi:hypothetical protein
MSESPLAVLRNCADRVEAETIRIRLAAAGIRAIITGTDAATALSLGGAPTSRLVRVEVQRADHERAVALLEEDQRRLREAGPWICSRCREQNEAAFDVCWSCEKPRGEEDERGRIDERGATDTAPFSPSVSVEPSIPPVSDDMNPYRPVLVNSDLQDRSPDRPAEVNETTVDAVTRAFRGAIVGMILFPPIVSLYSVYLLMTLGSDAYRDRPLRHRIIIAWCINLFTIPASLFFWAAGFS